MFVNLDFIIIKGFVWLSIANLIIKRINRGSRSLRQYNNCYYNGKFKNQDCTCCPYREYCIEEDENG